MKLGKKYRDTITGFEGVATGRFEYLHGCVRWCLTRAHPEHGGPQEATFDEPQIEEVEEDEREHATSRGTGGPRETPPRPGAA